jgi:hydroxyethylthiazole kinase
MIWQDIERIRAERPLVHNITNYVVMNTTANALLALGASPVMAHAVEEVEEMVGMARALSQSARCIVSVSGPIDLIVDGDAVVWVANGHPMMGRVTGMGCTASAVTGAFAAVNRSSFKAAVHAMALMGIAGEMAAERSVGQGSFQMHFLDILSLIQKSDIERRSKIQGI